MANILDIETAPAINISAEIKWVTAPPSLGYCCDVRLKPDETGGFVAYVAQLRGVVSEGDDLESALGNIAEALSACIETYLQEGMDLPWRGPEPLEANEKSFRIVVNV